MTTTQGYSLLLWVDPKSGRYNGSETILVPLPLADTLNAARRALYDKRGRTSAWQSAGVTRAFPGSEDSESNDNDNDFGRVGDLRPPPTGAPRRPVDSTPVAPAVPVPPAPSAVPGVVAGARKRRAAPGHAVHVISASSITQRRQGIELRVKFTSEEKKTETRAMDDLLARGETRIVGLKKDWRTRLGQLRSDMPNFAKVVDRIKACMALAQFAGQPLRIPPLLLAGRPGVGKTHFAMRVADVMGVPRFVYALESAETVAVLCGSEKHWGTSEPGELYKQIVLGTYANPVVVLDELDKAPRGGQYRPANALHAVLEPLTAGRLRDKCADLTFDASYTTYIATANVLSTIDTSLLSRFEMFHIDAPGPRAAVSIARSIGRQVLQEMKLTRRFEAPAGEVVQQLALLGGPRQMQQVLRAALGRAVLDGRTEVTVEDLLDCRAGTSSESPIGIGTH